MNTLKKENYKEETIGKILQFPSTKGFEKNISKQTNEEEDILTIKVPKGYKVNITMEKIDTNKTTESIIQLQQKSHLLKSNTYNLPIESYNEIAITGDLLYGDLYKTAVETKKGANDMSVWNNKTKDVEKVYSIIEKIFFVIASILATLFFTGNTFISQPMKIILLIFNLIVICFLHYDLKKWKESQQ